MRTTALANSPHSSPNSLILLLQLIRGEAMHPRPPQGPVLTLFLSISSLIFICILPPSVGLAVGRRVGG